MNKSQSMGMYVILAIIVLTFISSIAMKGQLTNTSEISYINPSEIDMHPVINSPTFQIFLH